ncbi:MAG: 3-hydroxylacyl-ACP dehydratase [Gammaproteobacteria bacterium]|nr:3-hydroxylacyl-ACP dehydratase [Gammaproteobacteria bacterium]
MQQYIGQSIEPYSPLSRSMCLLDNIEAIDGSSFCASVILNESSSFAESTGVPGWLGIEYMAQTIAAFAGVKADAKQEPVKIGFLLGSRKYQSDISEFPFNKKIYVQVKELMQDESGLGVFECQISIDDEVVAQARLNVFQPEDPVKFINEQENE